MNPLLYAILAFLIILGVLIYAGQIDRKVEAMNVCPHASHYDDGLKTCVGDWQ